MYYNKKFKATYSKGNNHLWLCVNYRGLNNLTIKN